MSRIRALGNLVRNDLADLWAWIMRALSYARAWMSRRFGISAKEPHMPIGSALVTHGDQPDSLDLAKDRLAQARLYGAQTLFDIHEERTALEELVRKMRGAQ